MRTLKEREQREYERIEIVRKAVGAADRIILDGSDGSNEETDWLTAEVAHQFNEKVRGRVRSNLLRRDFEES